MHVRGMLCTRDQTNECGPHGIKVRGAQAQSCCAGGRGQDSPCPSLPSLDVGARCACQVGSWVWIRMSPLLEHLPEVPPFPRTCADYCRPAPSPECGIVEAGGRAPVLPFRCWGELQALPSRRLLRFWAYASLPLRPVAHARKAPCSPSPLLPFLPPLLARGEWIRRRPLQRSDDGRSLFCCVAIFPFPKTSVLLLPALSTLPSLCFQSLAVAITRRTLSEPNKKVAF